jgi:hypothetical protein
MKCQRGRVYDLQNPRVWAVTQRNLLRIFLRTIPRPRSLSHAYKVWPARRKGAHISYSQGTVVERRKSCFCEKFFLYYLIVHETSGIAFEGYMKSLLVSHPDALNFLPNLQR